jgi:hypothetical protein
MTHHVYYVFQHVCNNLCILKKKEEEETIE